MDGESELKGGIIHRRAGTGWQEPGKSARFAHPPCLAGPKTPFLQGGAQRMGDWEKEARFEP